MRPYRNRGVAPLFASKESPFWYGVHFDIRKSASKYMKDLQMWAYCPHSRHVQYFIIHCQWLKINVDFRGESIQWSQTPSPLAYAVYAFINVDNCERPLKVKACFYIVQCRVRWTTLKVLYTWLPDWHDVHSCTDSTSLGSILVTQQLCARTIHSHFHHSL